MNFEELEHQIEKATKKAFIEIFENFKHEDIYGFSLYSDEGAMTVCPSTNTIDFLNELDEEEKLELPYYKFEPAEWKYEMKGADEEFNEISTILREELEKNDFENEYDDEKIFLSFQNRLYSICINVLKKLKAEDFFNKIAGKEIFLIFSVSEYEFDKNELKKMVEELNGKNKFTDEYLKWMSSWSK
jgi:hypothetical protein